MRTTARLLTCAALAAATIGVGAPGAYAGDRASLEMFPSTAAPGATITVNTTACGPDGQGVGDPRSLGVREFPLMTGAHEETVVGQFRIPHGIEPGNYRIGVRCASGELANGTVTIQRDAARTAGQATTANPADRSDHSNNDERDKDSGNERDSNSSGNHNSDNGNHNNNSGSDTGGQRHEQPTGHVRTGVGGSVGPDTTRVAAGVAVLAATAVGGTLLLRRRASGAPRS
ncbi:hypothetical protein ACFVIM_00845 [Streptomyces sp. NPDC057638]|uniref:hypothetical protein n=1 Tax=Streptomyces sp. NPDC057638 TaxID=3346190 RepID=UPI003686528E